MKKSFNKAIALMLSVMLALGCFSAIPALAANVTQDYGRVEILDSDASTTYDIDDNNNGGFAAKLENLKVSSAYNGTKIKVTNIDNDYLANTFNKSDNLIKSVLAKNGTGTKTYTYTQGDVNRATSGLLCTYASSGFVNSDSVGLQDADHFNWEGLKDTTVTMELKSETKIKNIYMFSHVNVANAAKEYVVYVSNDAETLFSDENEIAYFKYDGYDAYGSGLNNIGKVNGAWVANQSRDEGQIWDFTDSSTKPIGKYVGIKFLSVNNGLIINELGVFGSSVNEVTILDKGLQDSEYDIDDNKNGGFAAKLNKLTVLSNITGTKVKVTNIDNGYLSATFNKNNNLIKSITAKNGNGSKIYNYTQSDINNATRGQIGTYSSTNNGFANLDSLNLHDATHFNWDGLAGSTVTLELKADAGIDNIYMFSHVNVANAAKEYAVYVSDDSATLYNAKNEIAYFKYDGYESYASGLNTTGKIDNAWVDTFSRDEGQIWDFGGVTNKITGKYIGIKFISVNSGNTLIIDELGVFGHVHTGGTATCNQLANCAVEGCGVAYGDYEEHIEGTPATCKEQAICDVCGESYGEFAEHTEGTPATCITQAQCSVCYIDYGEFGSHIGGTATCSHQALCEVCGQPHGELDPESHENETLLGAIAATCEKTGLTEGKKCGACGVVTSKQYTTGKKPHTTKTTVTPATTSANGSIKYTCSVCGTTTKTATTIYAAKTVKLSKTTYTYNSKVQKPSVTIKDSKGAVITSSNYDVKYASGCKNVGKYSVKISFKGNYKGSKTLYFTINPKATKISKLSATKKGFTVKWSKQTSGAGYEIQYATSSNFKKAKTVKITKNKTTSKKITKLSGGKKYYVRIRTFKKVSGKTYYSDWSSKKSVKTKK